MYGRADLTGRGGDGYLGIIFSGAWFYAGNMTIVAPRDACVSKGMALSRCC